MSRKKHDTTPVAAAAELAHGLLGEDDAKPVSETRAELDQHPLRDEILAWQRIADQAKKKT
jgi:hypothetical protein